MSIPDTLSAILVPFCGTFVDRYGHRCKVMVFCGIIMACVHLTLGIGTVQTVPSPVLSLVALGFAYSMILTGWAAVPSACQHAAGGIATAFGIATATLNFTLTVFPILVAAIVTADPTYFYVEMVFVICSLNGVIVSLYLLLKDTKGLELPEKNHSTTTTTTTTTTTSSSCLSSTSSGVTVVS